VNEYLGGGGGGGNKKCIRAPRTFHMETLFNELKQIDNINRQQNQVAPQPSSAFMAVGSSPAGSLANANTTTASAASTQALGNDPAANDWSQSYWSSLSAAFQKQSPFIMDDRSFKWSTDYLTQSEATIFDEA
jgi:hypothetical protein